MPIPEFLRRKRDDPEPVITPIIDLGKCPKCDRPIAGREKHGKKVVGAHTTKPRGKVWCELSGEPLG